MKILCELVSVLPLDVRGLCREIAATGPAKRRVQSAPITRLISPAAHSRKVHPLIFILTPTLPTPLNAHSNPDPCTTMCV